MKRFWAETKVAATDGGFEIHLDGRPVRTPKRAPLVVPSKAMADAIAAEWDGIESEIKPEAMPLTGFANAAIDIVSADPQTFADSLSAYAESDLTCYRSERPARLVARQDAIWEPVLKTIEARHSITFNRTDTVMYVQQPAETLKTVQDWFRARSIWELVPLQPIVTITGSAVLAMAYVEGDLDGDACFKAGALDELFQAEEWGEDADAVEVRNKREAEFKTATTFLAFS